MHYTLRVATLADAPELEALIALAVQGLSIGFYSQEQIESALHYVFGVDTQLLHDGTYYVAEAAGRLVGCGGWSKRATLYGGDQTKGTEYPLLDPTHEPGRIRAFFVHPDAARQGIGRAIIGVCERAAVAAGFGRLELAATLPGQPLYRALGYQAREFFTLHLPDGVPLPLVRMDKLLSR